MKGFWLALSLLAVGPAAAQSAAESPAAWDGGDVGAWFAANVHYGPEWRPLFFAPNGTTLVEAQLKPGDNNSLDTRNRIELPKPEVEDGHTWRSALITFHIDCFSRKGDTDYTIYEGQNLTGTSYKIDNPNAHIRRGGADYDQFCLQAEAWRRDARDHPGELAGPKARGPDALHAWATATLDKAGWPAPPIPGHNGMLFVRPAGKDGAQVTADLRLELYDPQDMSLGVARSIRESVVFDCGQRTWTAQATTTYGGRNLKGRGNTLRPIRVLSFDGEDTAAQDALNQVCGPGDPGRAAPSSRPPPIVAAVIPVPAVRAQLSAGVAKPAETPAPPAVRDLATVRKWLKANVTAGPEWFPVLVSSNGLIMVSRGPASTPVSLDLLVRTESTFPTGVLDNFGHTATTRSSVTTYEVNCSGPSKAITKVDFEGQNLTGAARPSGLDLQANALAPVFEAACADKPYATAEKLGPGGQPWEGWAKTALTTDGWHVADVTDHAVVLAQDHPPPGRFLIRTELFDPILFPYFANGNTVGHYAFVRSVVNDYAVDCRTRQSKLAERRYYPRRNLAGQPTTTIKPNEKVFVPVFVASVAFRELVAPPERVVAEQACGLR